MAAFVCWAIALWTILLSGGNFILADALMLVGIGFMEVQYGYLK